MRRSARGLAAVIAAAGLLTGGAGTAVALGAVGTGEAAALVSTLATVADSLNPVRPVAAAAAVPRATPSRASRPRPTPSGSPAPESVAPLTAPHAPDLFVRVPRPLSAAQQAALQRVAGVTAVTLVDLARVAIGTAAAVPIAGVDPSTFRAFTPGETAASDGLWQAVARGDLAPTYGLARAQHLPLGGTVTLAGPTRTTGRVGAIAVYGLPGVDLVTSRQRAAALGAQPATGVLLAAPGRDITALEHDVRALAGPAAQVDVLRPRPVAPPARRPTSYRQLYVDSARYCPGLPWQVLAAIGQVESGHGRNVGPSSAGALGPMQFLPSTWAYAGVDGDGDGRANIMDPYDAVPSAALYLCRNGAADGPLGLAGALFAYNHADWYVQEVLALAAKYR